MRDGIGITWWHETEGRMVSDNKHLVITHSENNIIVYDVRKDPVKTVAYNCSSVDQAMRVAEDYWLAEA